MKKVPAGSDFAAGESSSACPYPVMSAANFICTPFCWSPCTRAMFDEATIGRYAASAPEFLNPSTSGPTSDVPNSTVVLRYTGSRPDAGAANCMSVLADAVDDADAP